MIEVQILVLKNEANGKLEVIGPLVSDAIDDHIKKLTPSYIVIARETLVNITNNNNN